MIKTTFLILILIFKQSISNEIVKDKNGNFFLKKKNNTYQKLPKPKPGNKYVIRKRIIKKKENRIFKVPVKKSRIRTNQGFK